MKFLSVMSREGRGELDKGIGREKKQWREDNGRGCGGTGYRVIHSKII